MRPNQIVVFDGLRITTEHVNHVQAAVNSSVYELRSIAGLRRVYSGFEVVPDGTDAVIVQPGLAYDSDGNRVISDDPIRLAIEVPPSEARYVVVRYAQIRDREVEGRPTLIWDSGEAEVRTAEPAESENVILLARVTRTPEGSLRIDGPAADVPEAPAPVETTQLSVAIDQGVLRLPAADLPPYDVAATLAGLLRRTPAGGPELSFPIAAHEVALPFTVCGVTTHTIVRASLEREVEEEDTTRKDTTRFQTTAQGEATVCPSGLKQFGLSQICVRGDGHPASSRTDLTEAGVAHLPFAGDEPATENAWLDRITLVVRITAAKGSGFHVTCALAWSGEGGEDIARQVEAGLAGMSWQAVIAWKVVGSTAGPGATDTTLRGEGESPWPR